MSNVVSARDFWNMKVDRAITRAAFTGNIKEMIQALELLGFNRNQLEEVMESDD